MPVFDFNQEKKEAVKAVFCGLKRRPQRRFLPSKRRKNANGWTIGRTIGWTNFCLKKFNGWTNGWTNQLKKWGRVLAYYVFFVDFQGGF